MTECHIFGYVLIPVYPIVNGKSCKSVDCLDHLFHAQVIEFCKVRCFLKIKSFVQATYPVMHMLVLQWSTKCTLKSFWIGIQNDEHWKLDNRVWQTIVKVYFLEYLDLWASSTPLWNQIQMHKHWNIDYHLLFAWLDLSVDSKHRDRREKRLSFIPQR
jgi:hypothetical protein